MEIIHVWILWHSYELNKVEERKLIGVYSSEANANAARRRVETQPGFCDRPDGFAIDRYELNKEHWIEGFMTTR